MSRDVFLTVNDTRPGYTKIGGDIVQPFAQVIMLDADQGDSNIIDLCRAEVDGHNRYLPAVVNGQPKPAYKRILIDTGPERHNLTNIQRVLKRFGWPKLKDNTGNVNDPDGYTEAALELLQITHVDEDHSAQGPGLLESVRTDAELRKSFINTQCMFHELPPLNLEFVIRPYVLNVRYMECIGNEKLLKLFQAANCRFLYLFQWQAIQNVGDPTPEPGWKNFATRKVKNGNHRELFQVPWSNVKAKRVVAIRCYVYLQQYINDEDGRSWRDVQANRNGIGKLSEMIPVKWLVTSFLYQYDVDIKPPPTPEPSDIEKVGIRLRAGQAAPDAPLLRGAQYFLDLRTQMDALTLKYNTDTAPPPSCYVDPKVQPAVQGKWRQDVSVSWEAAIVGPTPHIYQELLAYMVNAQYDQAWTATDTSGIGFEIGPFSSDLVINGISVGKNTVKLPEKGTTGDIQNRASIVSLFRRYTLDGMGQRDVKEFDMVFTGDAFERYCQVANTIVAFDRPDLVNEVAVLKVPHHGSMTTSDAGFYNAFRARVYLICASSPMHGNPRYECLEAIARGFEQDPSTYQVTQPPYLLFFSDPWCTERVKRKKGSSDLVNSPLHVLLHKSRFRPNFNPNAGRPIYNYRCFRLRAGQPNGSGTKPFDRTAGRILCGRNASNQLAVHFTVTTKLNDDPRDGDLDDWFEIVGTP